MSQGSETAQKSEEPKERPALERLLEEVASDATAHPEAYLRETIVPEGGE